MPVNANLNRLSSFEAEKTKRFSQDTSHREILVYWVIIVTSLWLLSIIILLWTSAFYKIKFSDKVYITLLATTTVNILGLPFVVLKGLFGDNSEKDEKDS